MISGEEEAAYAWVGVNYMSGSLLNASWGFGTAGTIAYVLMLIIGSVVAGMV